MKRLANKLRKPRYSLWRDWGLVFGLAGIACLLICVWAYDNPTLVSLGAMSGALIGLSAGLYTQEGD